jgi:ketosteroid isomerase-like protein
LQIAHNTLFVADCLHAPLWLSNGFPPCLPSTLWQIAGYFCPALNAKKAFAQMRLKMGSASSEGTHSNFERWHSNDSDSPHSRCGLLRPQGNNMFDGKHRRKLGCVNKKGSMNSTVLSQILDLEEQLRVAMLRSDVATLSELLAPNLIFVNHLGQLRGKEDDIADHRSGVLKVLSLQPSEQQVRALGDAAVVSVRMQISGTYAGNLANGDFRFTRVWARSQQGKWQIVAAHAGLIAP